MRLPFILWLAAAVAALGTPAMARTQSTSQRDALRTVQRARQVMMDEPGKAYAMGKALQRRGEAMPEGRTRHFVLARAGLVAGEAAIRTDRGKEGSTLIQKALADAIASGDRQARADVLLSRGSMLQRQGKVAEALNDFLSAMIMFQQLDDRRSQAVAWQYMGNLYSDAGDYARAERYFRNAAEADSTDPRLALAFENNIASVMSRQGRDKEALPYYRRAAKLADQMGLHGLEITILTNVARSEMVTGGLSDATATMRNARSIIAEHRLAVTPNMLQASASLLMAKGDAKAARPLIDEALRSPGTEIDADLHDMAYKVYKRLGDDRTAIRHIEIMQQLRDQANVVATSLRATLLAAQFDYANQELRIAKLKAESMRRNMQDADRNTQRQRTVFATIVGAALVIMAALGMVAVLFRRGRNRAQEASAKLQLALAEVEERQNAELRANEKAQHDALTGLPNRRYLHERLGAVPTADADDRITTLLLDLDRFKPINDIHGHETGDAVLIEVAARLRVIAERYGATAMRLGGDEFLVAMTGGSDDAAAQAMAEQLIELVSAPYVIGDRNLSIGTSIGISRSSRDGGTIDELLRAADIAMYEAKHSGRKTHRFFDEGMVIKLRERADIEHDLRVAIDNDQIVAHFQPIHNLEQGRTTGFEALARWTHAVRGPVAPDVFIPIAEDCGLIEQITASIVRQACKAACDWPNHVSVSVNLSPILLRDVWIAERILSIATSEGLPAGRLVVEITEHAVIDDLDRAAEVIDAMRAVGVRISMDDFGKGYSSLSHLRQLAFDHLKLDASFVRTIDEDDSLKIATAVAGLGRALRLPVTAEGVETQEVAEVVRDLGFTYAQGFHYGRAMSRADARMAVWHRPASPRIIEAA